MLHKINLKIQLYRIKLKLFHTSQIEKFLFIKIYRQKRYNLLIKNTYYMSNLLKFSKLWD